MRHQLAICCHERLEVSEAIVTKMYQLAYAAGKRNTADGSAEQGQIEASRWC